MVVIGVLSRCSAGREERLIRDIFSAGGKKAVIAENERICGEQITYLADAGVEYLILTLRKDKIKPVYLDVLILESCSDITSELIKCVAKDTRLIYNIDSEQSVAFVHPNAISYGMSYRAEATASSIDNTCDGISFVYCLQRPVQTLLGEIIYAGEKKVELPFIKPDIDEVIAAVTCSAVCGVKPNVKTRNICT